MHGFCTVCPCQPSFDWFAQPVGFPSTQKGAEQAPGISPQPAHARSGKLECDQSFFCAKRGLLQASSETRRPASKNHFQTSRGSWASEAPGSRPAASQPPACPVSSAGPPRCRCPAAPAAPASAGSRGPPSTAPSRCTSPY